MPWLADLVESSEGSFNVLPVQCLCEFLLNSTSMGANEESSTSSAASNPSVTESENQKMKKKKQKLLLLHLQNLLQHPINDEQQQQGK